MRHDDIGLERTVNRDPRTYVSEHHQVLRAGLLQQRAEDERNTLMRQAGSGLTMSIPSISS